jgi:hypothetical protein
MVINMVAWRKTRGNDLRPGVTITCAVFSASALAKIWRLTRSMAAAW